MVLWLTLFTVAILALAAALLLYRRTEIPPARHRFQMALSTLAAAIVLFIYGGTLGWAVAIPVMMLTVAALFLTYWWAWKWDRFMERRSEDIFARRPELRGKFEEHPFLKHFMKKSPR